MRHKIRLADVGEGVYATPEEKVELNGNENCFLRHESNLGEFLTPLRKMRLPQMKFYLRSNIEIKA